jgi:hypothetical protein
MRSASDDLYIAAILRLPDCTTWCSRRCHVDPARKGIMVRRTSSSNLIPLHVLSPLPERCPFVCPILPFSCFHYPRSSRKISVMRSLLYMCVLVCDPHPVDETSDKNVTLIFCLKKSGPVFTRITWSQSSVLHEISLVR